MKKIYLILFCVFLNLLSVSCTPASLNGDTLINEDCCGGDGGIQPPLPPPENTGG